MTVHKVLSIMAHPYSCQRNEGIGKTMTSMQETYTSNSLVDNKEVVVHK
jgi:hypothetical protein